MITTIDRERTSSEPAQSRVHDRGRNTISAKVVSKIVEQSAFELSNVGAAAGGFLGIGSRREFASRPSVEVDVYGTMVVVRMDIGLIFPTNLARSLRQVRSHVSDRVRELTGFTVEKNDITVSWLHAEGTQSRELL